MKRISAIALFSIATLAAANGLFAQQPALKANIPFNFTVGEQSMPAGEYTISAPMEHVVRVQSADRRYVNLALTFQSNPLRTGSAALVFDKCGQYYFLRRISSPAHSTLNLEIPRGKAEKNVQTREASLQTEQETLVAER
jgi:hypothetical protein